jgi:hypothetical protein
MWATIYKIGAVIYHDHPNCKVRQHYFTILESYDTTPLLVGAYDFGKSAESNDTTQQPLSHL